MSRQLAQNTATRPAMNGARDKGTVRRKGSGVYYDRDSGRIGFGNKYGERSFNQRPVHADPLKDKRSVIDQSQFQHPNGNWVRRDRTTGQFVEQKSMPGPYKGLTKEPDQRKEKERSVTKKPNVWVSPRSDGSWAVQREGAERATRVEDRKVDAERRARDLARRDGVEVIIQGKDGKIQGRESYGSDPFPPRDREH